MLQAANILPVKYKVWNEVSLKKKVPPHPTNLRANEQIKLHGLGMFLTQLKKVSGLILLSLWFFFFFLPILSHILRCNNFGREKGRDTF